MTNNTTTFRISTRPRLLLGARIVDFIDANPYLSLAMVVAFAAGMLLVLA